MDTFNTQSASQKGSMVMWVIGLVVVVIAIWFYFGGAPTTQETTTQPLPSAASDIQKLETQGSSDEIADIEADLNATDLNSLDQELTDIDKELEGI